MKGCWSSGDDDQYRLRGGTQAVPLRIAEMLKANLTLSSPVISISATTPAASGDEAARGKGDEGAVGEVGEEGRKEGHGPYIVTSGKVTVRAKNVVITGSPSALLSMAFDPPMSASDAQLLQRMPMGTSLKFFAIYEEGAWWKEGANPKTGTIVATKTPPAQKSFQDLPPLSCQDHSPYRTIEKKNSPPLTSSSSSSSSPGVLMCWLEGRNNLETLRLDEDVRRAQILEYLAYSLDDRRAVTDVTRIVEFNWYVRLLQRQLHRMTNE